MKVIISRTDSIGETILTLPMAKMIKSKYPDAEIVFIVSDKTKDLFTDHKYIDSFWVLEKEKSFFNQFSFLYKKFKEFKANAYFFVGGSNLPSLIAWFANIKIRGGLKSGWKSFLFLNKGIRQVRSMVIMHEFEYNLNLLRPLDIEYKSEDQGEYLKDVVSLSEETRSLALGYLNREFEKNNLQSGKDYIVLHPGIVGDTLNWPSRNFGRLISRIRLAFPNKFNIIISHTPNDETYLEGLKDHLSSDTESGGDILFLDGAEKGLRNYMGVIAQAKLFIGPSTGPTHLANVLGVKMVGLYSPIKSQSALRWGPLNRDLEKSRVIIPDVVCGEQTECLGNSCPYYECMSKVEVEEVLYNVKSLLNN